MVALDPRINPFRPEIAAKHLKGQVEAERFVEGVRHEVVEPIAAVRRTPSHEARLDTQALLGERVIVYETTDEGWAWGQLETDGYVGWLSANALGKPGQAPTHKVVGAAHARFSGAGHQAAAGGGAADGRAARHRAAGRALRASPPTAGICRSRISRRSRRGSRISSRSPKNFSHAPYLWGGKTSLGIDCSGLVQVALQAAGIACPRDSDMQEMALGKLSSLGELRRGDLVFWKGHVAIARDGETLLHANAHHMAVAIEPAAEAIARIKAAGSDVTSVKRI